MIAKHIANLDRRMDVADRDAVQDRDRLTVAWPGLVPPSSDLACAQQHPSPTRLLFAAPINGHSPDATLRCWLGHPQNHVCVYAVCDGYP
jgi:hypothetical protein